MLVHLVQPLAQRGHWDAKVRGQAQLQEHGLHQADNLRVIKLVAVEGGQPETRSHLLVKHIITDFEEAPLHLLMFAQARLSVGRPVPSPRQT